MKDDGFRGTLRYMFGIRLIRLYVLFMTLLTMIQYGLVDAPERINFASMWGVITFALFYTVIPFVVVFNFNRAGERALVYWSLLLLVSVICAIEVGMILAFTGPYELLLCLSMSVLRYILSVVYLSVSIGTGVLSPSTYGVTLGEKGE
jgi:hypothetical protein